MNIKIKKINSDDIKILQEISIETFTDTFGEQNSSENLKNYLEKAFNSKKLLSEIANPFSDFYLIYFDKEPAGYLKLNDGEAQSEKMDEEALEIERIYIRKKFQRNGLGKFLLNKAIDIAKNQDKKIIWLGVWENNKNAIELHNQVRALNPHPLAYTYLNGSVLKIVSTEVVPNGNNSPYGTVFEIGKDYFLVSTKDSSLKVKSVQPQGKKVMTSKDFLNGKKLKVNDVLGQ